MRVWLPGSSRPNQHRYRALDLSLAGRLQSFRAEHDVSQAEVAAVVGAGNKSVVAEWENGVSVPSGLRKRRLIELLEGKRWQHAVRWYRRASREVTHRRTLGEVIHATLEETRQLLTIEELRDHCRERDDGWPATLGAPLSAGSSVRLTEDETPRGTSIQPKRTPSAADLSGAEIRSLGGEPPASDLSRKPRSEARS